MSTREVSFTDERGTWAGTLTLVSGDKSPKRRRSTFPKWLRIELLGRQQHRCAICRGPMGLWDSHIDHVIPVALGGGDDRTNLQLVHVSCNLRKGVGPDRGSQELMPWA